MIVTVFRNRLRDDAGDAYSETAAIMSEAARKIPGYHSHKTFVAEDGERVTIVEFETLEGHREWAAHAGHQAAQQQGRAHFYAEYHLQVCQVIRESIFPAPE